MKERNKGMQDSNLVGANELNDDAQESASGGAFFGDLNAHVTRMQEKVNTAMNAVNERLQQNYPR